MRATAARLLGVGACVVVAGACGLARAGERAEVPAGTLLSASLEQTLDTRRHGAGTEFRATVVESVTEGERVLIPEGAAIRGRIVEFAQDPPRLTLEFQEIEVRGETHLLEAELAAVTARARSEMRDEGAKIGGGAAAGAVLGAVIGGDVKGAVIGAAAGAAAGTGVALATKDRWAYLPAGSVLRLRLDRALNVRLDEPEEGAEGR